MKTWDVSGISNRIPLALIVFQAWETWYGEEDKYLGTFRTKEGAQRFLTNYQIEDPDNLKKHPYKSYLGYEIRELKLVD